MKMCIAVNNIDTFRRIGVEKLSEQVDSEFSRITNATKNDATTKIKDAMDESIRKAFQYLSQCITKATSIISSKVSANDRKSQ
jgi:hypothetical protein